jgi:hypothetical protein
MYSKAEKMEILDNACNELLTDIDDIFYQIDKVMDNLVSDEIYYKMEKELDNLKSSAGVLECEYRDSDTYEDIKQLQGDTQELLKWVQDLVNEGK